VPAEGFQIQICGDVDRGHTVAEITYREHAVAGVFETPDAWHIETFASAETALPLEDFLSAVAAAKESLSPYVHRRGENPPEGLTRAGYSLWLMEKSDETAMGVRV